VTLQKERMLKTQLKIMCKNWKNTHKENVLAILSHDLRSPLSSIIATTKYLKDNFERMKPETVKEMLELVYDSSIAELNMLDSLVDWARIKYASEIFSNKS
jgi:two-component system CheB/CheR fusion protein